MKLWLNENVESRSGGLIAFAIFEDTQYAKVKCIEARLRFSLFMPGCFFCACQSQSVFKRCLNL